VSKKNGGKTKKAASKARRIPFKDIKEGTDSRNLNQLCRTESLQTAPYRS
jgi:hypothetical protein